jgi:transcriptional regulator with XRE-family HTH domain
LVLAARGDPGDSNPTGRRERWPDSGAEQTFHLTEREEKTMQGLDAKFVAERLREVVADEPKAFAYDIGVSLSAVYNYLNGRIPSTEVLFRIARQSGHPMEWFLEGCNDGLVLERNGNGNVSARAAIAA